METIRIFADHYQFYIYDAEYDHYSDENLDWSSATPKEFGYLASDKAIYVKTISHLNDHCVRLYINEKPQSNYEQIFQSVLTIESGKLALASPSSDGDDLLIKIEPGIYSISVCGNSIGKDMFSYEKDYDEEMSDEEYCCHEEFENYDIYVSSTT